MEVSGTINLETGHFPIFADPGSITITGFKELKAEATGRMDGSGYVVRNVTVDGKPSTIQITSTPDSKISLLSKKSYRSDGKQTAVVEDGSPQGQGTLIQGGNISIVREAEEEHSIVMTAHSYTEGHIDIKGAQAVTIGTPERKREFAVQGFSKGNGFSTININQPSKGQVIINGSVAAESAEVNINYAGKDSRQNGEVLAAKSHLDSEKEFTLNGTGTQGTQSGIMNLSFSGEGAGMKGNMTAKEGSSITADFSGDNAFFDGNITADGEKSSVTVNASGRNAVLTGNVSVKDGGKFSADISGDKAALTGDVSLTGGSQRRRPLDRQISPVRNGRSHKCFCKRRLHMESDSRQRCLHAEALWRHSRSGRRRPSDKNRTPFRRRDPGHFPHGSDVSRQSALHL